MVEKIDKALEVVFKIMKVLLILVLVSMIVILMAHIIFRYVLNNSLTWSEELLKIMLVWFGMMSVAVLAARREHVAIVVFKEHMPKKVQNFLTKLTQLIIVGICVFMVIIGIQYCMKAGFRLTPALRIPYAWASQLHLRFHRQGQPCLHREARGGSHRRQGRRALMAK